MNNVTNFDAKKAFVNFISYFPIQSIYIDEYWDYYIQEYNLEEKWNDFLKKFIDEGFTYETFRDERNRIIDKVCESLFSFYNDNNISTKCKEIFPDVVQDITIVNYENLEDGKYIYVDLNNYFDLAMKFFDEEEKYVSISDTIDNITSYDIFKNQSKLSLDIIDTLPLRMVNNMYKIDYEILLENLHQAKIKPIELLNETCELVGKTNMHSLIYKYSDDERLTFLFNDYVTYHIYTLEVKTITIFGNEFKYVIIRDEMNKISNLIMFSSNTFMNLTLYPFALKLATGEELNEKDLAVGYEDEIFFHFDKSEII